MKIIETIELYLQYEISSKVLNKIKLKWNITENITYNKEKNVLNAVTVEEGAGLKIVEWTSQGILDDYHKMYGVEVFKLVEKVMKIYNKGD